MSEEDLRSSVLDIQEANVAFQEAANVLLDIAISITEMSQGMSTTKVEKSKKTTMGMFKTMAKAAPQAFVLEKLMMLLEPFINLMDLFTPIIEILAAIIEVGLMPIMQELMPVILLVVQFLWQYKDAMADVVKIIIVAIKWFFAMNVIWKTLIQVIMFLYGWHVKLLAIGMDIVKWLVDLVRGFSIMGISIGMLTDKVHSFLKMIKDMIDDFTGMGFDVPGFAGGGVAMSPMLAMVGENEPEFIIPFSKMGGLGGAQIDDLIFAMEENTAVQLEILEVQERKARWER